MMGAKFNRFLAALAVAVLIVTLSLVSWLRQHSVKQLERSVADTVAAYDRDQLLHGPGGQTLLHFELAEWLTERSLDNPYIRGAVVTMNNAAGTETPVVPFTFLARYAEGWRAQLAGWTRQPLGDPAAPYGYLYLDLDRSIVRSINWAMATIGIAILLMLITLLIRVWSQETSLTRTMFELRERRRELIRLERLALAGELSAGLLHDLKKPVLNMKQNLEDLEEALGDFAPAAEPLQEMRRQTRLFFDMLSQTQIERFVRSDRVSEEYLDVSQLVEHALNLVRYERRGVEVIIDDREDLPPIYGQPFRLIQLFSNLILNAFQAMKGEGRLKIELEPLRGGVMTRFIDNGPGMDAEIQAHIFEPFYTTKEAGEGTGLGLSICRLIVEEMDGEIEVESHPGGPTTFSVWLPGETEDKQ